KVILARSVTAPCVSNRSSPSWPSSPPARSIPAFISASITKPPARTPPKSPKTRSTPSTPLASPSPPRKWTNSRVKSARTPSSAAPAAPPPSPPDLRPHHFHSTPLAHVRDHDRRLSKDFRCQPTHRFSLDGRQAR